MKNTKNKILWITRTALFIAILIVILVAVIIGGILEIKDNNFNIMSKISISAVSITVLYNLYHLFKNFSKWWNLMRKGEILSNKQFSTLGSYIILVEHELLTGSKIKFVRNL